MMNGAIGRAVQRLHVVRVLKVFRGEVHGQVLFLSP